MPESDAPSPSNQLVTLEDVGFPADTPGGGASTPTVGKLNNLKSVRLELARVYRAARLGEIGTQDGYRLASILQTLARLIEGSDLETRIAKLEAAAAEEE